MALHSSINNVLDKKLFDITSKLIHGQCNPDPLSKKAEKLHHTHTRTHRLQATGHNITKTCQVITPSIP